VPKVINKKYLFRFLQQEIKSQNLALIFNKSPCMLLQVDIQTLGTYKFLSSEIGLSDLLIRQYLIRSILKFVLPHHQHITSIRDTQ
jgi:hypothetical protein